MIGVPEIGSSLAHWAITLADMLAKGSVILAIAGLASLCLHRSSAAVRHLVWAVGLMGLLVLPILSLTLPNWQVPVLPQALSLPVRGGPPEYGRLAYQPVTSDGTAETGAVGPLMVPRHDTPPATALTAGIRTEPRDAIGGCHHWSMGLVLVWATGALVVVARYAISAVTVWCIGRQATLLGGSWAAMLRELAAVAGVTRRVALLRSNTVITPMACGIARPRILVPAGADSWSDERRRLVLLHELSHVRRFDNLTQTAIWLACALHWLNPLVWLALSQVRRERECACDDAVIDAGFRASDYGCHLLAIARAVRTTHLAAVTMARPSRLEARLCAILRPGRERGGVTRCSGLLATALSASILVPVAAVRPTAMAQEAVGKKTVSVRAAKGVPGSLVSHDMSGRVLGPDGQPVAGATVCQYRSYRYARDRTGVHRRIVTGPDGSFVLKGLACDRAKGILDGIVVIQPGFGILRYLAWAYPEKSTVALQLPEEVCLKGVVVDPEGQPVPGALVTAVHAAYWPAPNGKRLRWSFNKRTPFPQLTSEADASGRFTIPHLPKAFKAEIVLHVQHRDYAHDFRTVHLEDVKGVAKIMLEPGGAIEGKVVHRESGKPVAGTTVSASGGRTDYSTERYGWATTNSEGHYLIDNLPAKVYSVRMQPASGREHVAATLEAVAVVPGQATLTPDLKVTRGGSLSGKVTDADTGAPVPSAWVYAEGRTGLFSAHTKADGSFRIRCPEGDYELVRSNVPKGYLRQAKTNRRNVTVREGQTISGLDFEAVQALSAISVAGKVLDPSGRPVRGAVVHYLWGSMPHRQPLPRKTTATDARGDFRLPSVPPHETVRMGVIDQANRRGRAHIVSIAAEAPQDLVIELLPLATLAGRVVDPKGRPIPQVWVNRAVHPRSPALPWPLERTRTAADGTYELDVMPNEEVLLNASIATQRHLRMRGPKRFSPAAGRRYALDDIVLSPHRILSVEGQVLYPGRQPATHASVKLFVLRKPWEGTCDEAGVFLFDSVRTYGRPMWIRAYDKEGKWAAHTQVDPDRPRVTLHLTKAGSAIGRVVDGRGRPVSNAQVVAYIKTEGQPTRRCSSTETDGDGTYRLDRIPTGQTGYVRAKKAGYASMSSDKWIFQSEGIMRVAPVRLLLANSAIAGEVWDAERKPLAGVRVICTAPGPYFRRAVTDTLGMYRIDGIPDVNSLIIETQYPGFRPTRRDRVKAGSTDVDFVLEPSAR